jgi:hypothetical protein
MLDGTPRLAGLKLRGVCLPEMLCQQWVQFAPESIGEVRIDILSFSSKIL